VFGNFFGLMGQPNGARLPMQKELSSQLTFVNPSLDNPLGFSGTPLISLPWKAIAHFLGPDHALMKAGSDKVINGELGAGREWWEQMLPSWANRIIGGVLPTEDMGSKYGAAIQSTLANMEAAGMFTDPQYQTPEGKAKLLHALQVGIHNDLLATAIFGFFARAPRPTRPGRRRTPTGSRAPRPTGRRTSPGCGRSRTRRVRCSPACPTRRRRPGGWRSTRTSRSSRRSAGVTHHGRGRQRQRPGDVAAASFMENNHEFFTDYGGKGGVAAYLIPQGKAGTPTASTPTWPTGRSWS
jgi:hypothetical protein